MKTVTSTASTWDTARAATAKHGLAHNGWPGTFALITSYKDARLATRQPSRPRADLASEGNPQPRVGPRLRPTGARTSGLFCRAFRGQELLLACRTTGYGTERRCRSWGGRGLRRAIPR